AWSVGVLRREGSLTLDGEGGERSPGRGISDLFSPSVLRGFCIPQFGVGALRWEASLTRVIGPLNNVRISGLRQNAVRRRGFGCVVRFFGDVFGMLSAWGLRGVAFYGI
ncbi:unnamed protein product, partial [Laminaria digitata]